MNTPFKMLSKAANLMMRVACDPGMKRQGPDAYPYSANRQTYRMLVERLGYLTETADGLLVQATDAGRAYRAWSRRQPGA